MNLDDYVECPACNAEVAWEEAFIGALGIRYHFRCPCCGMGFSHTEETDDATARFQSEVLDHDQE